MTEINNNYINSSKTLLIEGLSKLVSDKDLLNTLICKTNNLNVIILNNESFIEKYREFGGTGQFLPGGFAYQGVVYLKDINLNIHTIIHEMLHGISRSFNENGDKSGLFVGNKKENYMYGRGFNEAFTEYLTSLITHESFNGYSKDFQYVIELFMEISNLKTDDVLGLYLQEQEWLNDEIIDMFDENNKSLPNLIIEYDNKTSGGLRKSNPNNIMNIILDAIDNKMGNSYSINAVRVGEKLKELNNYFYSVDVDLDANIKNKLSIILDRLGTYNISKNK